ncbi:MAG: sarcosine oxidase subunit gamma [Alphaproteobacteria bacterium]|nr:sarcosine oxidase subunit gamma [Alphaproteobacteria bacterium]
MGYHAHIERLDTSAIIDLKGRKDALVDWKGSDLPAIPERPNTATDANGLELYWIGNDHWLLRAPLDREEDILRTFDPGSAPHDVSAVLVSDTLVFFSITGPDAGQILSIVSPLDIALEAFTQNGVSYSEAFGLKALIIRRTEGYELAVERSYADMAQSYFTRIKG